MSSWLWSHDGANGRGGKGEVSIAMDGSRQIITLNDVDKHATYDFQHMKRKRVLGSGAFGQVLLMEAGKGNGKELLAVKILHSGAMDLDGLRLFLSEAKLMQQLHHSNLVGFKGFGSLKKPGVDLSTPITELTHDSIFLAQEYMPGGTLRELIAKQMSKSGGARLYDWNDVFRWAKGIAEGLQYLHEQSPAVVHRDLKPENIIFDGKNPRASSARIADFGLSKCIRSRAERESMAGFNRKREEFQHEKRLSVDKAGQNQPRMMKRLASHLAVTRGASMSYRQSFSADSGPPHSSQTMQQSYFAVEATGNTGSVLYMAPEVFLQEPYNEKADVFAFGTILYEMLKSEIRSALFLSGQPWEIERYAREVANGYRRPFPTTWPEPVTVLISQLWAQKAQERPSMKRVVAAIQDIIDEGVASEWEREHGRPVTGGSCSCFGR